MKQVFLFYVALCLACDGAPGGHHPTDKFPGLKEGVWRFSMDLGETSLPFTAIYLSNGPGPAFVVKNAEEEIYIRQLDFNTDSLSMTFPVFGSVLKVRVLADTLMAGYWYNESRGKDYRIPVQAVYGNMHRFEGVADSKQRDFSGKWEVIFNPNSGDNCKAIGLFQQEAGGIRGTFLTEMGDYRFLEGNVFGDQMSLSGFDGSHAFLFHATINDSNNLRGIFWSGTHWKEAWTARRNNSFSLIHPDSLALLKEGAGPFNFSFPDLENRLVSFTDARFRNKVVLVQLMGSWCPNCADESYVFADFYNRFHADGLEVVAVAYERLETIDEGVNSIRRFKKGTHADYQFLYGGKANKEEAAQDFPMISEITSFPTALFVDRGGKIRKIHTGFYGPGAGEYHAAYKEELELFLEKLLREKISS